MSGDGAAAIHATAVVVGETGVLLRGPSGAGKSAIALALIELASQRRLFVRLVADDRVLVRVAGGRVLARPHPAIAGRIERRGRGIEAQPFLPAAVVGLIVDVGEAGAPRLPDAADLAADVLGVAVDRIVVVAEPLAAAAAILARLRTPQRRD